MEARALGSELSFWASSLSNIFSIEKMLSFSQRLLGSRGNPGRRILEVVRYDEYGTLVIDHNILG